MKQRKLRHFKMKVQRKIRFGRRCSEYFQGCIRCEWYRFFDSKKRFPYRPAELINFLVESRILESKEESA